MIGTLATKAVGGRLRGGDRHRRQGLLPAGARRHQGLQPEGRRHLVRRRGREGEVRRAPDQVVDVLALMGDSIDNIKGVPGIGEKGARDLIAHVRHARSAAGARRRGLATSAIARGCWSTPTTRGRAASSRASAPTCRSTFDPEALRYRGAVARALLRAVHAARLPIARDGVRADGRHRSARTTRWSSRSTELRGAGRRAARGRTVRAARAARRDRPRCAPASSGCRSRPRRAQARYVPLAAEPARRRPVRRRGRRRGEAGRRPRARRWTC